MLHWDLRAMPIEVHRPEVLQSDGETVHGGTGLLAVFDPAERREVRATADTRLLLLLAPWPGVGR